MCSDTVLISGKEKKLKTFKRWIKRIFGFRTKEGNLLAGRQYVRNELSKHGDTKATRSRLYDEANNSMDFNEFDTGIIKELDEGNLT